MALAEITLSVKVDLLPEGFRFRGNWRGKLILQRSYESQLCADFSGHSFSEILWRDATATDLQEFFTIKETKQ